MANWGLFLDIAITNGPCSVSPRNEPRITICARHRWPRREPGDFGSVRPHSSRWSRGRVREAPLPISLHIPYKRDQWQATYGSFSSKNSFEARNSCVAERMTNDVWPNVYLSARLPLANAASLSPWPKMGMAQPNLARNRTEQRARCSVERK